LKKGDLGGFDVIPNEVTYEPRLWPAVSTSLIKDRNFFLEAAVYVVNGLRAVHFGTAGTPCPTKDVAFE